MLRLTAMLLAAGVAVGLAAPASAQTEIKMIGFGGGTNVPSWVAIDKGFFLKEGLKVTQDVTRARRSRCRTSWRANISSPPPPSTTSSPIPKARAPTSFPITTCVAIAGVHSGMNTLVARPEIKKYSDLKGKVVAVDSPTSGYATVLYQIVKDKSGLEKDKDYTTNSVGGTGARVKALKDGTGHVAMISSPNDMQLKDEGFTILGDAATEIGEFQGSAYAVRKSYAKDHPKEVEAFLRGIVAATDYVFSDKAGTVEVLKSRIKGLSDADAGQAL